MRLWRQKNPVTRSFCWKKSSATMMHASCGRVQLLGSRACRNWRSILALVSMTALLQVGLSSGDLAPCNADKSCPDPTYCCSRDNYCGKNTSFCGKGNCIGGACELDKKPYSNALRYVGISAIIVAGLAIIFLGVGVFVARRRSHQRLSELDQNRFVTHDVQVRVEAKASVTSYNESVTSSISGMPNSTLSLQSTDFGRRLSYETLHLATKGFSVELGRGSFGVVYKGTLADGTEIAVKQLLDGQRDIKDFEAEMKTLGRINHANLVALLGFAFDSSNLFLVYEFVAKGSLDRWIFEGEKWNPEFVLPWKTRVDILKGTAKGLAYLHEELQRGQMIVHLDIKPQNILLDTRFAPKISDFGLAKLLVSTAKRTLATGGTKGYMAPEVYVAAVSQKMDVYSFGIVMLEVVSGREHEDPDLSPDSLFLPAWAIRKVLAGEEVDVVDQFLDEDQFDTNEAELLIWIALLCLQGDPSERPGMSSVLRMMEGVVDPPDLPATLQTELEMAERLIRVRLGGVDVTSSRKSSDYMIRFSDDSRNGSRRYKGSRRASTDRL